MTKLRVAAWIGVATTVAALTAGAILGLAAQARADEIERRYTYVDSNMQPNKFTDVEQSAISDLKSDGNLYNGLAIGFFSASAALAVATTVMFVVDWKQHQEPSKTAFRLAPTVDKNGGGLAAAWSF